MKQGEEVSPEGDSTGSVRNPGTVPISIPWSAWGHKKKRQQAVVVGSGYGGSVAALRLAEQGWQVVVLERGGEILPGQFPNDFANAPSFFRLPSVDGRSVLGNASGLWETRVGPGVGALVGNGVGGGSLINAGVLMRPENEVFAQQAWPSAIRHAGDELCDWFELAYRELGGESTANLDTLKASALERLGKELPGKPAADALDVTIGLDRCTSCGDCATGCNVAGAKKTLRDTYLGKAFDTGSVTVISDATVYSITPFSDAGGKQNLWRLRIVPTSKIANYRTVREAAMPEAEKGAGVDLEAALLVLSAGTFGSVEILQRSVAINGRALPVSTALGARFSGNGDAWSTSANEPCKVNAIGIGADHWRETASKVGPTVTRALDLRYDEQHLLQRIVVEDGAVPGALGGIYSMLLSTSFTSMQLGERHWHDPRGAADHLGSGRIGVCNPNLAERTQFLLTMGHDESKGMLLWREERDSIVPVFDDPAELETYKYQERVLSRACEKIGSLWIPAPAWRFLPAAMADVLSGPGIPQLLMTVHPLGGCVMGDEPRASVVDHCGRVRIDGSGGNGCSVFENLYVLDGSIVPTSLGCNPLWTITMLAERALDDEGARECRREILETLADVATQGVDNDAVNAVPPIRDKAPVLPVYMEERLVCESPRLPAAFSSLQKNDKTIADLEFRLHTDDWMRMWDSSKHVLCIDGQLRIGRGEDEDTRIARSPIVYNVVGTAQDGRSNSENDCADDCDFEPGCRSRAELLVADVIEPWRWIPAIVLNRFTYPLFRALDRVCDLLRVPRFIRDLVTRPIVFSLEAISYLPRIPRFARAVATYLILRGWEILRDWRRQREQGGQRRSWSQMFEFIRSVWRYLCHATEVRYMHYELELELQIEEDEDATRFEGLPLTLYLIGDKHIEYAASCAQLWDYIRKASRRKLHSCVSQQRLTGAALREKILRRFFGDQENQPLTRPLLRETFLEQASNLHVVIADKKITPQIVSGKGSEEQSIFSIDYAPMIEKLPLRLKGAGDLPNALVALAEYPMVLVRYLLKTRINDFRAPNYSGRPLADVADPRETTIRTENHGPVAPERIDFRVPLGHSSSDEPGKCSDETITLTLWRYRQKKLKTAKAKWHGRDVLKVKSVLLVHAFAQSGYSFTLNTTRTNPAAHLYDAGFEVWILEHRLSTRLRAHERQVTVDQIARYDIPTAVNRIIKQLESDLKKGSKRKSHPPLQIFSFAQCVGGASTCMALLSGKLSYDKNSVKVGDLPDRKMPKLAGLFLSQTHPHCIAQPLSQAKTWVPAVARDALRIDNIPFSVRDGEPTDMREYLADRIFAALPVPKEEECPMHLDDDGNPAPEDDAASCRRIRFIEAPLFKHVNVNDETHRQLPLWFGDANVRTFAQLSKWVEAERLVTEDGDNAYVNDLAFHCYAGLPICFLHGDQNELFHPEGARRAARNYSRVQPDWAAMVEKTVRFDEDDCYETGKWRKRCRAARIVDGYAHVDLLVGKNAAEEIFGPVAAAFESWFEDEGLPGEPANPEPFARAHMPLTGPLIGAVTADRVGISFRIDDRFSDGKSRGQGSRTWAFARFLQGETKCIVPLEIMVVDSPLGNTTGPEGNTTAFRMATGELPVKTRTDLEIECFSVHEVLVFADSGEQRDALPVDPGLLDKAHTSRNRPVANRLLDDLLNKQQALLGRFTHDAGPGRYTKSRLRHHPERFDSRWARIPRRSFKLLAEDDCDARVTFAVASCRYPGFRIEHRRMDRWIRLAEERLAAEPGRNLDFGILLGDQIYADATGGFADPLNPTERYFQRYRFAFARYQREREEGEKVWFGDWLSALPVMMTPDDHEFHDAYPDGPPIVKAPPGQMGATGQQPWIDAARDSLRCHQQGQLEPYKKTDGIWIFNAGPARVIIVDSRSQRLPAPGPIITEQQLNFLESWLGQEDARQRLNIIATGSVIAPGKRPNSSPVNPGREDNFQIDPGTREKIFKALRGACELHGAYEKNKEHFRFLLLSGDYHRCARAVIKEDGVAIGACIVAPPLNSPMPFINSSHESLWFDESLPGVQWTLEDGESAPGSALGIVTVSRDGAGRYLIKVEARRWDPFAHNPATELDDVRWEWQL